MPRADYDIVDPSTLQDKVRAALQAIQDIITAGLNKIIDLIEAGIKLAGSTLNLPGAAALGFALHRFEGKIPEIWAKFRAVCGVIWDWIGKISGNPLRLWDLALAYQNARAILAETDQPITDVSDKVVIEWEGKAAEAFTNAMTSQQSAWDGVNQGLDGAAGLVAQQADNLCKLWIAELANLAHTATGVMNGIASAADVAKAAAGEIAPIIATITAIADGVVDAGALVWDDIATAAGTGTNSWNSLNAGLSGLDSNDWPVLDSYYSTTMSAPTNWDKKESA